MFASNAFAILGLRALYFLLAGMADRFRYLNIGLGVILAFVGIKMMMVEVYHMPTYVSLGVIAIVLTVTIVASLRAEKRDAGRAAGPRGSTLRPAIATTPDEASPAGELPPMPPLSGSWPGGCEPATMPRTRRTRSTTTGGRQYGFGGGLVPGVPSTPT